MKNLAIITVICLGIFAVSTSAEEIIPLDQVTKEKLISYIDSLARGNVAAARVNVASDMADKKVRIFAIVSREVRPEFNMSGYSVEMIYDYEVAKEAKTGIPSYQYQHNNRVMAFAAAQFASGKKEFGQKLIECLAEAQPNLFWSSPTHPPMTIREIQNGLNKDDETVKEFLRDESEDWNKHSGGT